MTTRRTNSSAVGVRWALANPDKAAEISVSIRPDLSHDEAASAIRNYAKRNLWGPTGVLPAKSPTAMDDLMMESGQLKAPIAYEDFVVTEFTSKI